ncbi:BA3454 family stress response protein [Neobacillus sp. LXY-4]
MIEVIVTVKYKNKNYQTNVITNKEVSCEEIKLLAEKQVMRQWGV